MSSPSSSSPRGAGRIRRAAGRPAVALLTLVAVVAIVAGWALTFSSFTSQAGTPGNTFASRAQFDVRLSTAPAISGTAAEGSTLTGTVGTWKGSPTSYSWRFQRCTAGGTCSDVGTGGTGTSPSYAAVYADAGYRLRLRVTASNAVSTSTVYSAETATVTSPKPYVITAPTTSGSGRAGDPRTGALGTWGGTPAPTVTYSWDRCVGSPAACTPTGQTGLTIPTTLDDEGANIRLTVTATNTAGSYSMNVGGTLKPPLLTAAAGLIGTAEVGMRLTSSPGFNGPVDSTTVTYQWQRCATTTSCVDIDGATDANYTTTTADVGNYLRYHLKATAADGGSSVDKDSVMTDEAVKARRMASIGDAPTALTTAPDGRLFVGGTQNMKFAKAYTGPLAAVSADGVGALSQVSKTPLVKTSTATSTAVIGDGQGGYILGVTGLKAPDGTTRSLVHIRGDGSIDTSYPDTNAGGRVVSLARGKDNTIYVGGSFTSLNGTARQNVGAISAGGQVTSWNPGADAYVYGIATAPGGRVYLAGDFLNAGGAPRNRIAAITTSGALITSFNPPITAWGVANPTDCVGGRSIKVAPDGVVYMTGFKCTPMTGYAVAFRPDGVQLAGYAVPSFNDNPHDLWVTDTKLYVGGFFTTANGATRKYIARFDRLTGAMDSWAPAFNGVVWDIVQQGERLYTVGQFTQVDGVARSYSAGFDMANGGTLNEWAPKLDGAPNDLVLEGGGVQMTGANMAWWGAETRAGLAVLDRAGQLQDTSLDINTGRVKSIAVNGSDAWIGGNFTAVDGAGRTGLARIDATSGDLKPDTFAEVGGDVRALLYSNDSLWVGGAWSSGLYPRLARYTGGAAASPTTQRPSTPYAVLSLAQLPDNRIAFGGSTVAGVSDLWTNPLAGDCTGTLNSQVAIWVDGPTGAGTCPYGLDFTRTSSVFATTNTANVPNGGILGIAAQPTITPDATVGARSYIQGVGSFQNNANGTWPDGAVWNWAATSPNAEWKTLDLNAPGNAVIWSPDTNAFISGGDFTAEKNGTRPYLVAHSATDTPLATWTPPALGGVTTPGAINALAADTTVVYATGSFTTVADAAGKQVPSGNLIALDAVTGGQSRYGR
jgi:hypothetical protein